MGYRSPDDLSRQSAIALLLKEHAPSGGRVLAFSSASDNLGAQLRERGFDVHSIEKNPEIGTFQSFGTGPFDAIVFDDVLEYLNNPLAVIKESLEMLSPTGFICSSVHNTAHASVIFRLLKGSSFEPTDELPDRNPRTFFTHSSLIRLLHDAGLGAETLQATVVPPHPDEWAEIPDDVVSWVVNNDESLDFQYICLARKLPTEHTDTDRAPDIQRLAQRPEIALHEWQRSYQEETVERLRAQLAQLQEDRYKILTVRDYAIGVEHELGSTRYELTQAKDELSRRNAVDDRLRQEIIQTHSLLADAVADSQSAHARLADALTDSQRLSRELTNLQQKEARNTTPSRRAYAKLRHMGGQMLRRAGLR